jgi:Leucine-rich repeat (LRR) protein
MRYLLFFQFAILSSCSNINSRAVTKIDLSSKKLTEIPDSIFEYKNLTELHLGAKEIVFYPPLSVLSEGDKEKNRISELTERISEFKDLKTLILNSNKLKTLPNSISDLENLEVLDVALNNDLNIVNEIPKLKTLSRLKTLKITDADFNRDDLATIKKSLGKHVKLIYTIDDYMVSYNEE